MSTENPRIERCHTSGKECLRFVFGEGLTAVGAAAAIGEWREAFRADKGSPKVLIRECRKVKGHDSAARVQWTAALNEMKPQIDSIRLITDSTVIRMGAAVMSMVTSIDIKAIRTECENKA